MGLFDEKLVVAARLLEETLMLFEHGNPKTDEEKNQYYSRMANLVAAIDVYAKENPVSSRLIGPISSETGWNRIKHDYNLVVNVAQTNMHNFYLQIIREEKRAEMPNVMAIELNVKSQALFRALNHAREAANAKVGFNSDKPRLLASEQARRWYKEYINTGIEFVKNNYGGQSLENQAKLAFAVRHGARVEARDLMDNSLTWCIAHVRDLASYGNVDGPSFNSLIDQHRKNGLSSEQAFQKVLETSTKTNQLVDEWRLGSENEALLQKQSEMLPMPEAQPEKVLNVQQSFK
jgi:hypothetical protein